MRRLQLLVLLLVCMLNVLAQLAPFDELNVLAQNTSEFQQLMKKAKAGNAKAQYELGDCYWYGDDGAIQSYEQAAIWYAKSANQGYAPAQVAYGLCYVLGKGVPPVGFRAFEEFEKAAKQGDSEGQYYLAGCYLEGRGVDVDPKKAFELFSKSAKQGYAEAYTSIGECYYYGKGVKRDYAEAVRWFLKNAETEEPSAYALYHLSRCYRFGRGVEANEEKAEYWQNKAIAYDSDGSIIEGIKKLENELKNIQ